MDSEYEISEIEESGVTSGVTNGLHRDDTIMVKTIGATGTDNLSRIQSISSKHFEALGESLEEGDEEAVDMDDVALEEGRKRKEEGDQEGEGDEEGEGEGEEDEIEEDPDKRNRLDGYYVAMAVILALCILGTLSYMAVTKLAAKDPEPILTTEGLTSTKSPAVTTQGIANETLMVTTEMDNTTEVQSGKDGPIIDNIENKDPE